MDTRFLVAVLLLALSCSGEAEQSGQAKPMPPTNLKITISPVVGTVDRGFGREGIPKTVRVIIYDSLNDLEDSDLLALMAGLSPQDFSLAHPDGIETEKWKRLVASYADAMITDRRVRSELMRQVIIVILSVVLTAALTVPVGMWLERRKERQQRTATERRIALL